MTDKDKELSGGDSDSKSASAQVAEFLIKVCDTPIQQVMGIANDWLSLVRYKNLLRIRDKVAKIHKDLGVTGNQVPLPPKFAIPIIQAASLEDEEVLQNLWAQLIANATASPSGHSIHPAYSAVIRELSGDEALIVNGLTTLSSFPVVATSSIQTRSDFIPMSQSPDNEDSLYSKFDAWCLTLGLHHPENCSAYLTNLQRIGLLEIKTITNQSIEDSGAGIIMDFPSQSLAIQTTHIGYILISKFGEGFLRACGLLPTSET